MREGMHILNNKYQILCGKGFLFCPDTSFIHLAAAIFYITVTGPKGGSAITGHNKVTYLLVIDPDKCSSICWKWHFSCCLVVTGLSVGILLQERRHFNLLAVKPTVSPPEDDKLFIVSTAPFSVHAIY